MTLLSFDCSLLMTNFQIVNIQFLIITEQSKLKHSLNEQISLLKAIKNINYYLIIKLQLMPAYSIAKAKRQSPLEKRKRVPGVGAYETSNWKISSNIKTSPSASLTKAEKFFNPLDKKPIQVGPGSYNPEKPNTKLYASIKGKSKTKFDNEIPGVASYHPQKIMCSTKYSFPKSSRSSKFQQTPGPANYQIHKLERIIGGNFSKQVRTRENDEKIPGPGYYDYFNQQSMHSSSHEYTFPKEKKFMNSESKQKQNGHFPGPGNYSITDIKKKFKFGKFTQAQRSMLINSLGPGPAGYNPVAVNQQNNPFPIIGTQRRFNSTHRSTEPDLPGPGSYNMPKEEIIKKKMRRAIFTQQARDLNYTTLSPGPGAYQVNSGRQFRGFSISARHNRKSKQKSPGPLDYNPKYDTIQPSIEKTKFGQTNRFRSLKTEGPGVGKYQIQTKKKNTSFKFNKAHYQDKLNLTVGPGQYKIKPSFGMFDGVQKISKQILYV